MLASCRAVSLAKSVEDIRQEAGIDAHPGIHDDQLHAVVRRMELDVDASSGRRELQRVPHQVPDHLLQAYFVSAHFWYVLSDRAVQRHAFGACRWPERVDAGAYRRSEIDGAHTQLHPAAGDSWHVNQVLDELPEDACVALQDRHCLLGSLRIRRAAIQRRGPSEDHVQRRAQLVWNSREKLILQTIRIFGGLAQLVFAREQLFALFFNTLAFEVVGSLSRQQIHESQLLLARSMRVTEMRRDDSQGIAFAANQRHWFNGQHVGLTHGLERSLTGIDLTVGDIFYDHALFRFQCDTTGRVFIVNAFKKLNKRVVKTCLRHQSERFRVAIEQLNIAFVRAGYLDGDVQNLFKTTVDVVSVFRAACADFIQSSHCLEVSRAVFEDPKQSRLALAQLFRALRNLVFESVLCLA